MRIYLASRYSRIGQMGEVANMLRSMGHRITCRWIEGDHQIEDRELDTPAAEEKRERFALEDFSDIAASDCVISFTEVPRSSTSRGGRHVELGIALGLGLRVVVVGPRENVFHCLPRVEVFPDVNAMLLAIGPARAPFVAQAGRWALLFVGLLSLSGCWGSSTRSNQETRRSDTYHIRGALNVPIATETGYSTIGVPVDLVVDHDGSESLEATSETKTQLDLSAISGLVIAGLKQAFPILSTLGAGAFSLPALPAAISRWLIMITIFLSSNFGGIAFLCYAKTP